MRRFFMFYILLFSINSFSMIKVALTFDDGPSAATENEQSSTQLILDILKKERITAAFFILTTADRFHGKTLPRGETKAGYNLIKTTVRDGHLIACHWGGSYGAQKKLHPNRLHQLAYDIDGNGVIDKVTPLGNALESDLIQCKSRLQQALNVENKVQQSIQFIRPPLWVFKNKKGDARSTYQALGLKMILTDAKLYDGGLGLQRRRKMVRDMAKAIKHGEKQIVLTLHDSMMKTAINLPKTLKKIRKKMYKLDLVEGVDWSFTHSYHEMKTLLLSKQYFYLNDVQV